MNLDKATAHWALVDRLATKVAAHLNVSVDTIETDVPLAEYGIDAATSLALCADLGNERGISVETTLIGDNPTIDVIAAHLVHERATS